MAFPTPKELQELIGQLNDVAKSYNASPDLVGFKSRAQIIEKAKKISRTLIAADDMGFAHCFNVSTNQHLRHIYPTPTNDLR
jgi:hypothetical protein